jgi:hypothetical protein
VLRIVRGDPSDAEIAALIAVIAGLAGAGLTNGRAPEPTAPRSVWADPARRVRACPHPGPGGWRASTLPR